MSNTGTYKVVDGELVKISDKVRLAQSVFWPVHNDPRTNGMTFEHMDHKPIRVSTKRQLRYEMESRGIAQKDA